MAFTVIVVLSKEFNVNGIVESPILNEAKSNVPVCAGISFVTYQLSVCIEYKIVPFPVGTVILSTELTF